LPETIKEGIIMLSLWKIAPVLITFLFVLQSCSNDDNPVNSDNPAGPLKIGEAYTGSGSMLVQVWSESKLFPGFNNLYITISDSASGSLVKDAHVKLNPMMDMGTMKHSTPYENPLEAKYTDGKFPCSVVFLMPSTGGTWTLNVSVHDHEKDREGTAVVPVTVTDVNPAVYKSIKALNDSSSLYVSFLKPESFKVGVNDFEITIHKRISMMEYAPVTNYEVKLTPEMPSMGHGSPNNVDPAHTQNGHYKGKANFTMTGDWRLHLDLYSNGTVVDSTLYFDIVF
jgi:hypothetical protein